MMQAKAIAILLGSAVSFAATASKPASTGAQMVPAFAKGERIGFMISEIQPKTLYEKIGLKNGDIVTSYNHQPMVETDTVFKFATALKDGTCRSVEILRELHKMTLKCSL